MKTGLVITDAKYIGDYKIELTFSDNKINTFDFESLVNSNRIDCIKFKDVELFKKFYIENGDLVFNDNWDMLVPIATLYHKQQITFSGRPATNNISVRLRVPVVICFQIVSLTY